MASLPHAASLGTSSAYPAVDSCLASTRCRLACLVGGSQDFHAAGRVTVAGEVTSQREVPVRLGTTADLGIHVSGLGGVAMSRPEEGADTELRGTLSERVPGHVRLGVPSNLPAELSTFVGRADDLERGARLLGGSRLVTFTGA